MGKNYGAPGDLRGDNLPCAGRVGLEKLDTQTKSFTLQLLANNNFFFLDKQTAYYLFIVISLDDLKEVIFLYLLSFHFRIYVVFFLQTTK